MAELNFKQITDKLNSEFTGGVRKLIFWYDADGEFADDVDALELPNAKVYHLQKDNMFRTKIFLEREDTTNNYLIYAPFPKPDVREDHLADTLRYSKEFFADRASLLMLDLGIQERWKEVIQRYIKFFGNKQRTQAFYDLEIVNYNRATIEIGLMTVLCKSKLPTFEEVARCVLIDGTLEDNAILAEFEKYDLLKPFWQQCGLVFGYADEQPTLTKLVMTMFVTYAQKNLHADLPPAWGPFVSFKSGTIIAFIDNLMNSVLYRERFDALSDTMYKALDAENQFAGMPQDALVDCNLFSGIDDILLTWMRERLVNEDVAAKLYGKSILQICAERKKMHFGQRNQDAYSLIENAWHIVHPGIYQHKSEISEIVKAYTSSYYKVDQRYRYFYRYYDAMENTAPYEALRSLVERIYTNDYLNRIIVDYATALSDARGQAGITMQHNFYGAKVKYAKDRIVVIISDAMRYEVGAELFERLQADEKCTASISVMQSMLPSVTRIGMAALLPHRQLTIVDADNALVDDMPTIDLKQREAVLQKENPKSRAIQYDEIKGMNIDELRAVFTGQEIVYVYHDQIDARGDKFKTENEVFVACEEAIDEIARLIRRLTTSANTSHFIVTSDHGFIYKRDKLTGSDKIGGIPGASDRFVISDVPISESGICSIPLKNASGTNDERVVNLPMGSTLVRAPGSGKNYVHGGCSPQEMLVPVIEVKTERAKKETTIAAIDLISLLSKITNLITTLDFIQTEAVSDVVKEASYRIFFVSDSGEKISSENLFIADKKDSDAAKRIFRLRFSFKNQKYDRNHRYYLIAIDDKTNLEVLRREVIMDLAFADDFGF